jgi:hypothetical protein
MPGNVATATASSVMPLVLCSSFQRSESWKSNANSYANGEHEAASLVTNSRRVWELTIPLASAALATLRDFYDGRKGEQLPFYFYDTHEGAYDATGTLANGRYIVRFARPWSHARAIGRMPASISLIEIQ